MGGTEEHGSSGAPEPERRFTLEEATELLGELRRRLPRVRSARQALLASARRVAASAATDGGGGAGAAWFSAARELREQVEWLAAQGVLLRDAETGLVDFPSERDGEPIYLCWRLGEPTIAWYHDRTSGLRGRRPL
ncbi:MAG: hypothetical protein KatS3mg013_0526 [Actinomycetota bacterium]|jgi:hypothetical protein|nr:MAG: hypothetical protein KatS3mg013_0526 [Actinomycetota bacterium]